MFVSAVFAAFIASAAVVHADPTPSDPSPGDKFTEGQNCLIDWDVDTTGIWTVMNIELMSGDNYNMVYLTTVGTVNGADPNNNSFNYTCPTVTPNAPIYFYQFTSPYSNTSHWTGRFYITDKNGNTVEAANATQPDGTNVPWGVGKLLAPSSAVPEPAAAESIGDAQSTASGSIPTASSGSSAGNTAAPNSSSGASGSSGSSGASAGSSPSHSGMSTVSGAKATGSHSASSSASPASTGSPNGAGALEVNGHVFRAAAALGVAALTFVVAL